MVRRVRADGVIFAAPSFCDPALLDQPPLSRALEAAQIPFTLFKYAENTGQFQSIREQVGTFSDSSACGVPHEAFEDRDRGNARSGDRAARARAQGREHGAPEGDAGGVLRRALANVGDRPEGRLHLRARQPHRAHAGVRRAAGLSGDQRAAVGDAAEERRLHPRGRAARPHEDVCTYVKCDIGMLTKGNIGPTGDVLPRPDLLLLSYTGCFTFMKWFELLQKEYGCPVVMLHVPYCSDGKPTDGMRKYVAHQLRKEVIPTFEAGHRCALRSGAAAPVPAARRPRGR